MFFTKLALVLIKLAWIKIVTGSDPIPIDTKGYDPDTDGPIIIPVTNQEYSLDLQTT
jgi:hypothetical protein